jgi:hypothetical protein
MSIPEILGELRAVDAALADAVKTESDFLVSHRHLRTEAADGHLIIPMNAHLQAQNASDKTEFQN